jgi:UDP-glucuronate 4-epimerase
MSIFAKAILKGKPIKLFNHGNMRRDFTYVDDAVQAVGAGSWIFRHRAI